MNFYIIFAEKIIITHHQNILADCFWDYIACFKKAKSLPNTKYCCKKRFESCNENNEKKKKANSRPLYQMPIRTTEALVERITTEALAERITTEALVERITSSGLSTEAIRNKTFPNKKDFRGSTQNGALLKRQMK